MVMVSPLLAGQALCEEAVTHPRKQQHALVSPLVVLGALGTLVSTTTIVPHVIHAMRTRRPGGSPVAWVMGVTGSTIWLLYGLTSGDVLVGAPGLVTIPCGLLLAIWSLKGETDEPVDVAGRAEVDPVGVGQRAPASAPRLLPVGLREPELSERCRPRRPDGPRPSPRTTRRRRGTAPHMRRRAGGRDAVATGSTS